MTRFAIKKAGPSPVGARASAGSKRLMAVGAIVLAASMGLLSVSARSETLRTALERTLSVNPSINAEREKLRAVDESIDIAGAGYRPTITMNGDIARQNTNSQLRASGHSDDTTTPRGYSLSINQPLYRGGRTVAALNEADANVLAARESLRNVSQSVLLEVATTYVGVVRDTAIRRLRQNDLRLLGEQLQATIDRREAGVVTATDVALAKSRESAAKSESSLASANLRTSRAEYVRLTGRAPNGLQYPALRHKTPAPNLAAAIGAGKNENPGILAARYARDAARFAIDQIRGERLPELSLEAGYDQRWGSSKSLDEQRTANIRLRATVPLYQGGGVMARIRQAEATLRQKELEIVAADARVRSTVVSSWESMMAAKARIRSAGEQITAATKALTGIRSEESVGQRTVLDVLNAEQELLSAKVTAQQARGDHLAAFFNLLNAMGRFDSAGVY